jgi:hypothetical protein
LEGGVGVEETVAGVGGGGAGGVPDFTSSRDYVLSHIFAKSKYVINSHLKALNVITLMNVEFESIKALIDFPLT